MCPVSERVDKLIDFELMLEKEFQEVENIDEGIGDFLSKTKTKLGNYIKRKLGNNSLGQVVFRVADRLGLNYDITQKIVTSLNTKKGITSDKQNARRGRVNPRTIASLVTRGLGRQLYDDTATIEKMDAIFQITLQLKLQTLT